VYGQVVITARRLILVVGTLVLFLVVSTQYIQLLNFTGPQRPPLGIDDYLGAVVGSVLTAWTLGSAAIIAVVYWAAGGPHNPR
jgi:hypothetical protein